MHLGSHSATRGRGGVHVGFGGTAWQDRWCCVPHLLRAPGVGDNALTDLLNVQTHLEPTSQSRQHHQLHRPGCPHDAPQQSPIPRQPGPGKSCGFRTPFIAMRTLRMRERVPRRLGEKLVSKCHWGQSEALGRGLPKEQLPRPYPPSAAGRSAHQVSNFREQAEKGRSPLPRTLG